MSYTIQKFPVFLFIFYIMAACTPSSDTHEQTQKKMKYDTGTYGYDLNFLQKTGMELIELSSADSMSRILLAPDWQGRVLTSTSQGMRGKSYGWINYNLISSGKVNDQFNPFGGEERFWLGPEGGPYSLYFAEGETQTFENWNVPAFIDTDPFQVVAHNGNKVTFKQQGKLANAAGHVLHLQVERSVKLLDQQEVMESLNIDTLGDVDLVSYESDNIITNTGDEAWTPDYGFVSIWLLCMFNPAEEGVVFIPVKENSSRSALTDDYFGKVPDDRLKWEDDVIFFTVDGKLRSKIGVSPAAATSYVGGYDGKNSLTLVWYSGPHPEKPYVNSVWGAQENPLKGDAVNAYNDGPTEDGSILGPFYEIETSSPAALLAPSETMNHTQRVFHFSGEPAALERVTNRLFNLNIDEIKWALNNMDESE